MIDSVAEYEMVDASGLGRFVNGQILPVRNGGAKRALKYEDLLFLMEGKLERQNWEWTNGMPPGKVAPPGRFMDRRAFEEAVCNGYWGYNAGEYRDKDKEIEAGIVPYADRASIIGGYGPDWWEARDRIVGDVVELEEVSAGRSLKIEKLEKAYENMGKLKRTSVREGDLLWQNRRRRLYEIVWPEEGESEEIHHQWEEDRYTLYSFSGYTNGSSVLEFEETTKTKQYPYAKAAWLIMRAWTTVDGGVSTERGKEWGDIVIIGCEVTQREAESGVATVSWQNLTSASIAQEILGSHGETYYGEPTRLNQPKVQRIIIDEPMLLIEHDFPASEPEGI